MTAGTTRVLLLSPLQGLDPPTGDVTYTESLLERPPEGVEYTTYDVALADGRLRERYRRAGRTRGSIRYAAAFAREAITNRARRQGWLFREEFRHFDVESGVFDVVHAHAFATRLYGERIPIVVSNAIRIEDLYRDAFGGSALIVGAKGVADRTLARFTEVTHASYNTHDVDAFVAFSENLKREMVRQRVPLEKISVIPPCVSVAARPATLDASPPKIGFVGDWKSKGGSTALAAFERLRETGADAELVVVGSDPQLPACESAHLKVTWLPRQNRRVLIDELMPTFSVFVYPSRFDGLPLTLLEVMACGVPVIVSDYKALPDVVAYGAAGKVVRTDDEDGFFVAMQELLDPAERRRLGAAARNRVAAAYAPEVTQKRLGEVYHSVGA